MIGEVIFEKLFSAVLEAGVSMMLEAGLGDEVKELKDRLSGKEEKKQREAFLQAMAKAASTVDEEVTRPLLDHGPFREEVIAALLDPRHTMDFQAAAEMFGDRFPAHMRALRTFFSTLENTLLADTTWGPIVGRFQNLRVKREVTEALREKQLDFSPRELAQKLGPRLSLPAPERTGGDGGSDVHQVVRIFVQELVLSYAPPDSGGPLLPRYLQELAVDANLLPWSCVTASHAAPCGGADLRLADVYTDLDTTELNSPDKRRIDCEEDLRQFLFHIHEAGRIPAQEMANREERLLIMGDPGSGKSTFMKFLAYVLAQAGQVDDPSGSLARIAPWDHGPMMPVRVELRHLATFAEKNDANGGGNGSANLLLSYLRHMLTEWHLEGFWPELEAALRQDDRPMLILLDGLDEVPTVRRQMVVDTVNDFCRRYGVHRTIVTCRPYAYIGQPWRLQGFREVTLAPFDEKQIERFVKNWYDRLAERGRFSGPDASARMDRLQRALKRRDLKGLAERPLLLTIMAQLHAFKGELPDDRTELYEDAVKLLLQRWEGHIGSEAGILARLNIPELKMSDVEAGIYFVAYEAHARQRSEGETADVGEGDILLWLKPYLANDLNKAEEFVNYIRERAGLLIRHKTEAYTFPHRTFQEFLAACHLTAEDYPGQAAKLVCQDQDRWHEVFVLAAGHAARTHRLSQSIAAVNAICPQNVEDDHTAAVDPQPWRLARLAGETLLEIGLVGVQREKAGKAVLHRVQSWLVAAIRRDELLTPVERAASGRILAKLGDPRREVTTVEGMEFRLVPAGPFMIGEGGESDSGEKAKPLRRVDIPYDYRISRYPVTNAQFREFVEAGGYGEAGYWREAEKAGIWIAGKVKNWYDDSLREEPVDFGEPFNLSNHPVVGVTWYEALAFTRWMSEQLRACNKIPFEWAVRLPSEYEWEKAARGGIQIPDGAAEDLRTLHLSENLNPERIYPWGDSLPDTGKANYDETGINTTSAVGCFPGGASPYEVEEMAGNVWEWSMSLWSEDSAKIKADKDNEDLNAPTTTSRTLRGACFSNSKDALGCGFRNWGNPYFRDGNVGFRLVASHFTSGL